MCKAWTRTIIHTLAHTANMNKTTSRNISSQAFCLLAGIPDIGLRMQTLRITEFFLLINSKNCISGKTALARLNALCHKKLTQEALAKLFDKSININQRKKNRLGDVIKWMKNISLEIRDNTEDKSDIINQIHKQILQNKTTSSQHRRTQMDQ